MIPLYKSEIEAGLRDKIAIASTQAICDLRQNNDLPEETQKRLQVNLRERVEKAFGAKSESFDLFPLYTILVSTGWNKNDDVFGRLETWRARYTPEDKPFNLEHNPSKIIGHITASCPVDEQFLPIGDDLVIDDLPSKYHILTSAVIYQPVNQRDQEWSLELAKIIDEIKEGEWCVSMECLFNDFDYAVAEDGKHSIVNRNEDTAFLTKHLRIYGGTGSFQNKKVGRYLKNITFSGKGLTRKPANPDSVIFTDTEMFSGVFANESSFLKSGVNSNDKEKQKEISMANEKAALEQASQFQKENEDLKIQVAELVKNGEATQKQIEELTVSIKLKDEEIAKATQLIGEKDAEIVTFKNEAETVKTAKADLDKKFAEAEDKISSLSISLTRANRTISLYQYDLSPDEVKNIVDKFVGLADEQFNEVVQLVAKKKASVAEMDEEMKKKMKKKKMMEEEEGEASIDATEVVETATVASTDIPANSAIADTDPVKVKIEKARSDLRNYFSQLINKPQPKK